MKKTIYRTKNESYLTPLFWVHGEKETITREYIEKMHLKGIGSFVVEPRPHSAYLKNQWWKELDFIIDEAAKREMKVWLFDDSDYPSGCVNGKIIEKHPEYRKVFLKPVHIDALGPMKDASFYIDQWLKDEESVIAVVAGKRGENPDEILGETLLDISNNVDDGVLQWDIPDGKWRVFVILRSLKCEEVHTEKHINFLDKGAVKSFIDMTYEPTYQRMKQHFGKTIVGFFTDEPRFGNYPSYNAKLGNREIPLPYSDNLIPILSDELGEDFVKYLPLMWYQGYDVTSKIRYTYMNVISKLFSENYTQQIGDWCRQRNVKLIGHVIEENGAHARAGYGSGHFFRAMKGMDYSGLDVVYNLLPGYTSGTFDMPLFRVDVDFSHWGLAKMASSASHIDPRKNGITICEAFGAYGWQEGLKLMKWITDHLCVRGVNVIVPHAFTLKEFPDPDCPPHFYAGGQNPQWKDFDVWSEYANRVCHMITGGRHKATAAVLYHAEAEWAGEYEPFERTVRALAYKHIDCDIVPIDELIEEELTSIVDNCLRINEEIYEVLIVPYAEILPLHFEKKLIEFMDKGLPVVFIKDTPKSRYIDSVYKGNNLNINTYDDIGNWVIEQNFNDIKVDGDCNDLRHYHYIKLDKSIYFLVNESKHKPIDATIDFKEKGLPILYDALNDTKYKANLVNDSVNIRLEPYESIFVIFEMNTQDHLIKKSNMKDYTSYVQIDNQWDVSVSSINDYPSFDKIDVHQLVNISKTDILPNYSGIIRYENTFDVKGSIDADLMLDLGDVFETVNVWLNGNVLGRLICPPYHLVVPKGLVKEKNNKLVIEVTNTLAKTMRDNEFDRYMPQEPSGLIGPVKINIKK